MLASSKKIQPPHTDEIIFSTFQNLPFFLREYLERCLRFPKSNGVEGGWRVWGWRGEGEVGRGGVC